ncbi:molting protein mlt-4 [Anaeramoeba ignava]|uniref:Molting protein mlt-4 n=1 Tax=Anaeramoeba ignava TaxID=1746090 RepID=A0A9Q0L5N1_ANAIG|nr:molting protein mlt-4 [Anaeramoeba ignava]
MNSKQDNKAFFEALKNAEFEIADKIFNDKRPLQTQDPTTGNTPLHFIMIGCSEMRIKKNEQKETKNKQKFQELLNILMSIDENLFRLNKNSKSPLHLAFELELLDVVPLLVDRMIEVQKKYENGSNSKKQILSKFNEENDPKKKIKNQNQKRKKNPNKKWVFEKQKDLLHYNILYSPDDYTTFNKLLTSNFISDYFQTFGEDEETFLHFSVKKKAKRIVGSTLLYLDNRSEKFRAEFIYKLMLMKNKNGLGALQLGLSENDEDSAEIVDMIMQANLPNHVKILMVSPVHNGNGDNSLHLAIKSGMKKNIILELANTNNLLLSQFNNQGLSPLSISIKYSRLDVLPHLLDLKNSEDVIFDIAIFRNENALVTLLDWIKDLPLFFERVMFDSSFNVAEVFTLQYWRRGIEILESKNIPLKNSSGNPTLINISCRNNYIDLVEFFLSRNHPVNLDNHGFSCLAFSIFNRNIQLIKLLLSHKASDPFCIAIAVIVGDVDVLNLLLEDEVSCKFINTKIYTVSPLSQASLKPENWKLEPNKDQIQTLSPLVIALILGKTHICEILLKNNADCNFENEQPLCIATANSKHEIMKIILKYGGKIKTEKEAKFDPISISIEKKDLEGLKILFKELECRGETKENILKRKNNQGYPVLLQAVSANSSEIVSYLLSIGADPIYADKTGITSLQLAVYLKNYEIMQILIRNGALIKYFSLKSHLASFSADYILKISKKFDFEEFQSLRKIDWEIGQNEVDIHFEKNSNVFQDGILHKNQQVQVYIFPQIKQGIEAQEFAKFRNNIEKYLGFKQKDLLLQIEGLCFFSEISRYSIVYEKCFSTNLDFFNLLNIISRRVLENSKKPRILILVAKTLESLHQEKLYHGNLSPSFIFYNTETNRLKIANYGGFFSPSLKIRALNQNPPLYSVFLSPEECTSQNNNVSSLDFDHTLSDIFCLGLLSCFLFSSDDSLISRFLLQMIDPVNSSNLVQIIDSFFESVKLNLPDDIRDSVYQCLNFEPKKRIPIKKFINEMEIFNEKENKKKN